MDVRSYLSGYADGEACFCVSLNPSKRHALGWEIRPSFSVSQNADRAEVLYLFQQVFGCGAIRPDRSDHTLKYEVRSLSDLVSKVIPHFQQYPLLSNKQSEFEKFAQVCWMMAEGLHQTRDGFHKIAELAVQINSGKRKYTLREMKI